MPKNTELGFQSPRRTALRIRLLKAHPGSPITSRGQPKLPRLVSSPGIIWLLPGMTNLSQGAHDSPHFKAASPTAQRPLSALAVWGGWSPFAAPSSLSHLSMLRLAQFSPAAFGLLSVSGTHCPCSFPPGPCTCYSPSPCKPTVIEYQTRVSLVCHLGLFHDHATRSSSDGQSPWCFTISTAVTYVL